MYVLSTVHMSNLLQKICNEFLRIPVSKSPSSIHFRVFT